MLFHPSGRVAASLLAICILCVSSAFWDAKPVRAATGKVDSRPNVILILVDDLGWRDWSGADNEICQTPNIDQLARRGMQFNQAYAACAVCSPTRAAVQTGRYPARIGVTDWIRSRFQRPGGKTPDTNPTEFVGGKKQRVLCPPNPFWMESEEITLAELLREQGYKTAYIGKWHLGDDAWYPERQGFEVNFGGCDYGQPPSYFDPFNQPKHRHETIRAGIFRLPGKNPREYLTDREITEACHLIRQWKDEPFFIQLSHYAVHTPLQAPESDILKYVRAGVTRRQATYAAMVESVDRALGRLRRTLEATGADKNTIIWFTSDNGGLDNGRGEPTENLPLREGKGHPYEGGIRIPTIVHWEDRIPAGVSDAPVCSIDIMPTLLSYCDTELPSDRVIDGVSLREHLQTGGEKPVADRALLWHFPHYRGGITPYSIIRRGEWKLLHYWAGKNNRGEQVNELYNLQVDPGEKADVASQHPERVEAMWKELLASLQSMEAKLPRENPSFQMIQR